MNLATYIKTWKTVEQQTMDLDPNVEKKAC